MRALLLLLLVGFVGGVGWTVGFAYARDRFTSGATSKIDALRDQLTDAAELDIHTGDLEVPLNTVIEMITSTKKEIAQ